MIKIASMAALALLAPCGFGAVWNVCVDDRQALLPPPVRGAMAKEFRRLLGGRARGPHFGTCSDGAGTIALAIQREPPSGLEDVLGLAYREGSRIRPQLVVFHGPVFRHTGKPAAAEAVGRSIARVTAHEALHFLEQRGGHCPTGLHRPALSAHELTVSDPPPFHVRPCARHPDNFGPGRALAGVQRPASESGASPMR